MDLGIRFVGHTTRPELVGTFGVVSSTHWIASQVGMAILERGGNAVDAAVAAAFVLHIVEPHMNGLGGDVVLLARPAGADEPVVVCGQGPVPARATIESITGRGHDFIPGHGLLPAVVPGVFDAWMLLLRELGTLEAEDVLGPAIGYARHGAPVHQNLAGSIALSRERLTANWPSSAAVFLPGGVTPAPDSLLARPEQADTLERLVAAAVGPTREARIDAARRAFAAGFVAEAVDAFCRAHDALLSGDDLAGWSASVEAAVTVDHQGWRVSKASTWTQGPLLLQSLRLLDEAGHEALPLDGGEHAHLVIEALKLGFADREAWYGDPDHVDVPLDDLLDPAYARRRAALIGRDASTELRPGAPDGRTPRLPGYRISDEGHEHEEPISREVRQSTPVEGDTCHLDVIDRWGNVVAATPSGGWLQGSPIIPGLGFALGTRGQIFWLQDGLAGSLRPRPRPRTTLTPSMARGPEGQWLAFGSPGGDSQDQWCLQFLLRALRGVDLQAAIDAPFFQVDHGPSSFAPRTAHPTRVILESRVAPEVAATLRERGHDVVMTGAWVLGRNCAALREGDGIRLRAAASPRRRQAYAVGR